MSHLPFVIGILRKVSCGQTKTAEKNELSAASQFRRRNQLKAEKMRRSEGKLVVENRLLQRSSENGIHRVVEKLTYDILDEPGFQSFVLRAIPFQFTELLSGTESVIGTSVAKHSILLSITFAPWRRIQQPIA